MKHFGFHFVLVVLVQTVSFAEITKLSPEERTALESFSRGSLILSTTNLPPAIVALCADRNGRLAEPSQKWETTDLITDGSVPRNRLIWAAVSGERYVLHYERGGRGHSFHVSVFALAKGEQKPKVIWRGTAYNSFKDYTAFLEGLRSGRLDDKLDYAH